MTILSRASRLAMYNNSFGQSQFTIKSIKLEKRCMIGLSGGLHMQSTKNRSATNPLRRDVDQYEERITEHGEDLIWPRCGLVVERT
jgi:hypothetical protein